MQQAIPYRSWRPLHAHTHYFTTPQTQSLISHTQSINSEDNDNGPSSSSVSLSPKGLATEEGTMALNMVAENAVIVFGRRGCCMSHVVKRLLLGLGVNPAVYEVEEKDEAGVARELGALIDGGFGNDGKEGKVQFPTVFIGGKLFGGLDRLMATHISGDLVPILKQAGALWL